MSRFLGFVIFLVIAGSFLLHAGVEMPWFLEWIGNLPGDLIVKKGDLTLYLPITSSVIISVALSFISSLFPKRL